MPVGSRSPGSDSPYGCADMAGTTSDWTVTDYWKHPYRPEYDYEKPKRGTMLVTRDGDWTASSPGEFRCAARAGAPSDGRFPSTGFRLVRSTAF